ncbi:MAG: tetratricopeptide repeat protein [Cyanobacteriota bacterium]
MPSAPLPEMFKKVLPKSRTPWLALNLLLCLSLFAQVGAAQDNRLSEQGKLEEAIAAYPVVSQSNRADDAASQRKLGKKLEDRGKLDEAIAAYRRATQLDPLDAGAYVALGRLLFAQGKGAQLTYPPFDRGKVDEAIAAFEKAIQLDPNNEAAYSYLSDALLSQDTEKAVTTCQKAVHIVLTNAFTDGKPSSQLQQKGKRDCLLVIKAGIGSTLAYGPLGGQLQAQGKLNEAIAVLQRGIQLYPTESTTYFFLGHTLKRLGKLDEAIAAYRSAAQFAPKIGGSRTSAYWSLGDALREQGKLDEATAAYHQATQSEVSKKCFSQSWTTEPKELEEALVICHRAIQLDPKDADAHRSLGMLLATQGKLEEASAAYQKAIQLNPKDTDSYKLLGNALAQQGKLDKAITAYQKAIQLNPKDADSYKLLGNALAQQGKLNEANEAYQRASQLTPEKGRSR